MDESKEKTCWIFGDEAGVLGKDRFFSIGIIGTRKASEVIKILKEIRQRTEYLDEVSYKSSNQKRMLCAIRWMDWFFSEQDIAHFKIVIKDSDDFDVKYYEKNKYAAEANQLAYCQTYREVLNNFACYSDDEKGFVYSSIGIGKMELEEYLSGKINGITKDWCFQRLPTQKRRDGSGYTGVAEILQLCDLLTSSTRGLCCSLFGCEVSESWDKNMLRKNIHYFVPNIKEKILNNLNLYHTEYQPFEKQKFVVYKWKGGIKRQNAPIH